MKKPVKILCVILLVIVLGLSVFIMTDEISFWIDYATTETPFIYQDAPIVESTILDIFITFIGILSCIGLKKLIFPLKEKEYIIKNNKTKPLFVSTIISIAFGIFGLYLALSTNMVFIGSTLIIFSILGWTVVNEYTKEAKENTPEKIKINFYKECQTNNVNNFSNEIDLQRAKLIAEKMNLEKVKNLKNLYFEGKKLYEDDEKSKLYQEQSEALAKHRKREKELYDEYTKYAEYYGRDKRIAILKDKADNLFAQANSLESEINYVLKASQQKEIDWASHGGIASALAGGAAGAAVAIDAQIKNMEIREKNKNTYNSLMPAVYSIRKKASDLRKEASETKTLAEEAKIKLLGNNPESELINNIEFHLPKVYISDTGAFEVEVSVSEKQAIKIFDTVNAVIDGTITADLYQNETKVGSALLVLPAFGLNKDCQLKGICLSGAKKELPYEIKFVPYHLWTIEK